MVWGTGAIGTIIAQISLLSGGKDIEEDLSKKFNSNEFRKLFQNIFVISQQSNFSWRKEASQANDDQSRRLINRICATSFEFVGSGIKSLWATIGWISSIGGLLSLPTKDRALNYLSGLSCFQIKNSRSGSPNNSPIFSSLMGFLEQPEGERCGGIICDPEGNTFVHYAGGLSNISNNFAEAYALWQAIRLASLRAGLTMWLTALFIYFEP